MTLHEAFQTPSESIIDGVDRLLDNYVGLTDGEAVIVASHRACSYASAWITAAASCRGAKIDAFTFSNDQLAPAFEVQLLQIAHEMLGRLGAHHLVLITCELDTMSYREVLKTLLKIHGEKVRITRLINCTPDFFELCFRHDWQALKAINSTVLHALFKSRALHITSPAGTDLKVHLDAGRFRWVSNFGRSGRGELVVLPAGEVNTYPMSIDGTLVADGAFNLNFRYRGDVRLAAHPVHAEIRQNRLVDFGCTNTEIEQLLQIVFAEDEARNVGELGFGTNLGIDRFIALNSHINERHPGVHIGFGEHGQPGLISYKSRAHLDLIFDDVSIAIDDMEQPYRTLLVESLLPHPGYTHCEDTV